MLYKVAQHPDKTFIGWAARGIDFLGFHLASTDLTVAKTTLNQFVERIVRLYELGAEAVRIGQYVRRWLSRLLYMVRCVGRTLPLLGACLVLNNRWFAALRFYPHLLSPMRRVISRLFLLGRAVGCFMPRFGSGLVVLQS